MADSIISNLNEQLLNTDNPEEIQRIIDSINISLKKKNIIRTSKLNDLQDKISEQIDLRLSKRAGEFSNKDLIDYFKVMQDTITKNTLGIDEVKVPQIEIHQNNVNIIQSLDTNSRKRVADVIQKILNTQQSEEDYTND